MELESPVYTDIERFKKHIQEYRFNFYNGEEMPSDIFVDIDPVEPGDILSLLSGFASAPAINLNGHISTAVSAHFRTTREVFEFLQRQTQNNHIYLYLLTTKYDKLLMRYHRIPK